MLPTASKLRSAREFSAVFRQGQRTGSRHLMVHVLSAHDAGEPDPGAPHNGVGREQGPRAGFVISAKVGNSVVRHRIVRQLRPLTREQLTKLPPGTDVVIRALPTAASASTAILAGELSRNLSVALRKAGLPGFDQPVAALPVTTTQPVVADR